MGFIHCSGRPAAVGQTASIQTTALVFDAEVWTLVCACHDEAECVEVGGEHHLPNPLCDLVDFAAADFAHEVCVR
jgi:hypothetical protein